jgi:ABC-type transport system involved in cytochrome c biogenesis permease subunit
MVLIYTNIFNLKTLIIGLFFLFCLVIGSFLAIRSNKKKILIVISIVMLLESFFIGITWVSLKLPPVLQSVWFIPHVAAYMFAYAAIGYAFILAILELLFRQRWGKLQYVSTKSDLFVKIGTTALGIGLCLGAMWAKKAWGQYWSWDIKETAALITWAIFLLYLHLQKIKKVNRKLLLILVILGFLLLQFTWFGVKYMPSSQKSPHTFYSYLLR